ncbi:MAG: hypothetical protein GY854_18625 [Deltaproteobacteria bacterium]|nr:hypothetical protein [Deltaproteobacteria bacterium]
MAIQYIKRECEDGEIDIRALKAGRRRGKISKVKVRLIEKVVYDFGFSLAESGRPQAPKSGRQHCEFFCVNPNKTKGSDDETDPYV